MELKVIPVVSEKSYALSHNGIYVFNIPLTASKLDVKRAVAAQYGVEVVNVTSNVTKGKVMRTFRKKGAWTTGTRSDSKKAYVRLAQGQTLPIFAEADKAAAAAAKEKK